LSTTGSFGKQVGDPKWGSSALGDSSEEGDGYD
jgi:hypothetical protein